MEDVGRDDRLGVVAALPEVDQLQRHGPAADRAGHVAAGADVASDHGRELHVGVQPGVVGDHEGRARLELRGGGQVPHDRPLPDPLRLPHAELPADAPRAVRERRLSARELFGQRRDEARIDGGHGASCTRFCSGGTGSGDTRPSTRTPDGSEEEVPKCFVACLVPCPPSRRCLRLP